MHRILITGATGRIGSDLRPHLRRHYALRLFDRLPTPDPTEDEETVVGDLACIDTVMDATNGISAIVHLACVHGTSIDFDDTLDPNYRATLNLLEAARHHRIERFVFASSHHVLGQFGRDDRAFETGEIAPDSFYGLSKAFGEAACALYARRFDIAMLIVRIGNADTTVLDERRRRIWVSPRDLAQLVLIGLKHPAVTCDIVYGTSICTDPFFANERAAALGYAPVDHADDNLSEHYASYARMSDADGPHHLGGSYSTATLPSLVKSR
jgi:uronate dehydrogenase